MNLDPLSTSETTLKIFNNYRNDRLQKLMLLLRVLESCQLHHLEQL